MRKRSIATLFAVMAGSLIPAAGWTPAKGSPGDHYAGPYLGANNFPPDCIRDMSADNPRNVCYRMKTGLNAIDSPQIDVLVMVPVSPTAERDMRMMRQSVEMWENGIDQLAEQMGLDWLEDGVDFHVTIDYVDLSGGGNGGEFTTYPIVDPEIVVIATNPVGGAGIGIDPVDFAGLAFPESGIEDDAVPCLPVSNPFEFAQWENVPGFDNHHGRTGTYTEDCGGAGGNVCFAINGAIDPDPTTVEVFGLFDLVSHEFGHCLSLGHVGDGGEALIGDGWGPVPTNDIMSYNTDPPGLTKCVSTLDVESFAVRMSRHLDANGDGGVDTNDHLLANDQIGAGGFPFQVQHRDDHRYASSTGSPSDCPQPDLGPVPGERTDWTPELVATTRPVLEVTSPRAGANVSVATLNVTGTVEHQAVTTTGADAPTSATGTYDDADDDASTPATEILSFDVAVTPTHVDATLRLEDIWPSTAVTSPISYSVNIDGKGLNSFVRYPVEPNPVTWDGSAYMPEGTSTWDLEAKTVTFHVPRDYLEKAGIAAPYFVSSAANFGTLLAAAPDDHAPESGDSVGVSSGRVMNLPVVASSGGTTVEFEREDGNTFSPSDSSADGREAVDDTSHKFGLDVPETSDVELTLDWTDGVGGTNLDLFARGAVRSEYRGATSSKPESLVLEAVNGHLDLTVRPTLVTDPSGVTYTLTAKLTPLDPASADADRDGVVDASDACTSEPGIGPDGCAALDASQVKVYVDGALRASQDVYADYEPGRFDIAVSLTRGKHQLRVEWVDDGDVVATRTLTVTRQRLRSRR